MQNIKSQINSNLKAPNSKKYDLEDRTLEYGKRIIRLCKALPKNNINFNLADQVIRSGTSMGSNYREANETETQELVKIFAAILEKTKQF